MAPASSACETVCDIELVSETGIIERHIDVVAKCKPSESIVCDQRSSYLSGATYKLTPAEKTTLDFEKHAAFSVAVVVVGFRVLERLRMLQCSCRSAIPVTASLGTTRKSHRAVMCTDLLSRDDSCKPLASDSSPSLEHQIQNASPLLTCLLFSTTAPAAAAVPPSLELSPKKCCRFYAGGIEERWIYNYRKSGAA
jgi:hypothetical protein